jgi:hypothetical protein
VTRTVGSAADEQAAGVAVNGAFIGDIQRGGTDDGSGLNGDRAGIVPMKECRCSSTCPLPKADRTDMPSSGDSRLPD